MKFTFDINILYLLIIALLFSSCNNYRTKSESFKQSTNYPKTEYSENFENGFQSFWTYELADSSRVDIVKDPFDPQNNVLKVDLEIGDYVSGGVRTELRMHPRDSFGYTANYSFRFLLPESFFKKDEEKGYHIIHQWHDEAAPGFNWSNYNTKTKPPIHLLIEHNPNGDYFLVFKTGIEIGEIEEIVPARWKEKLRPNKWYTFSCEVLWSLYNKEGYAEPSLDGEYIINYDNNLDPSSRHRIYRRNMYNIIPNYFKLGLYLSGKQQYNRTVYFDDIKFESRRIK